MRNLSVLLSAISSVLIIASLSVENEHSYAALAELGLFCFGVVVGGQIEGAIQRNRNSGSSHG